MVILRDGFALEKSLEKLRQANPIPDKDDEVPFDESFSYNGYQVVRGEYFAHLNEPTITFNKYKISLNAACIKRLPQVEYVQVLIHQINRKLVVRPCREDDKHAFVWCSQGAKRLPKQVTARGFFAKLLELTRWNPDYRYKILGKMFKNANGEFLFIFDIDARQEFPRAVSEEGILKSTKKCFLPLEWAPKFGPEYIDLQKEIKQITFEGYTTFCIQDNTKPNAHISKKITET